MTWLGHRLGYRRPEDWYGVRFEDFAANGGDRFLYEFDRSPCLAVMEFIPDFPWKEWLFARAPKGFWSDPANHHRWLEWFEESTGIEEPEGWYGVTTVAIRRYRGSGEILRRYGQNVLGIASFRYPDFDWIEWRFHKVPKGFWLIRANRLRYAEWLGRKLGVQERDDWYNVRQMQIRKSHGSAVLAVYRGSPSAFLADTVLADDCREWLFYKRPNNFWRSKTNRKRYLLWVAEQLGFESENDLWKLRVLDLLRLHGGAAIHIGGGSVQNLLRSTFGARHPAVVARAKRGRFSAEKAERLQIV